MNFEDYQNQVMKTAVYPSTYYVIYPAIQLAGEAGEAAEVVGKWMRGDFGNTPIDANPEVRHRLIGELGDVLWHVAALCTDLGVEMSYVAEVNLAKLADRARRGVIQGSGDYR